METAKDLALSNLSLHKSNRPILNNINLSFPAGTVTVIIGPSGCGKSSLLRCIAGLEPIKLPFHSNQTIGMVFQGYNLFPHLTVRQNIELAPTKVRHWPKEVVTSEATKLMELVGLKDHQNHLPSQLSGGQQQRAAIARALALKPNVLLYDEPTSALDPKWSEDIFKLISSISRERNITQIVVTHELSLARKYGNQIVVMDQGQVVETNTAQELFTNASKEFTRHFLKEHST